MKLTDDLDHMVITHDDPDHWTGVQLLKAPFLKTPHHPDTKLFAVAVDTAKLNPVGAAKLKAAKTNREWVAAIQDLAQRGEVTIMECDLHQPDPRIVSLAEAKSKGLKRYFTGKPCVHGHISERRVSTLTCIECSLKETRARQAKNPELWRDRMRRRRAAAASVA
jgi:hypothetical protein